MLNIININDLSCNIITFKVHFYFDRVLEQKYNYLFIKLMFWGN